MQLTPTDLLEDPADVLHLGERHALAIVHRDGSLSAVPVVAEQNGWRRATAGCGAADALVRLIAATPGRSSHGRFSVVSWTGQHSPGAERPITVDQTNESVIVGDRAVVKWTTHLEPGPHPAPSRLSTLTSAGFTAMPAPWGMVTWKPEGGDETLVATVTGYMSGAVDGWTWAVDLVAAAAASGDLTDVVKACTAAGEVIADLHASLAGTAVMSTQDDANRWRRSVFATLEDARKLASPSNASLLTERASDIATTLNGLSDLVGVPILDAHGDLHVGQILRADDRFVVTDFDGNPVLPPAERVLPIPAAVDVAGLIQSLSHVAIVAAKHHDLDPGALGRVDEASRSALLDTYVRRLAETGHAGLFAGEAMAAFRLQQVLREIVYAGRHLPRWMYVPDAALPTLLKETSR